MVLSANAVSTLRLASHRTTATFAISRIGGLTTGGGGFGGVTAPLQYRSLSAVANDNFVR